MEKRKSREVGEVGRVMELNGGHGEPHSKGEMCTKGRAEGKVSAKAPRQE